MRGYELFNFPAFDEAQKRVEALGWKVFSPAQMDRAKGFDPSKHTDEEWAEFFPGGAVEVMARDLEAIAKSDAIILLPGWMKSRGARLELMYAQFLDKEVLIYEELLFSCKLHFAEITPHFRVVWREFR
jgi:hypothetical protein